MTNEPHIVADAPALDGIAPSRAVAALTARFACSGPLVLGALPPFGAKGLTVREIADIIHSEPGSIRCVLHMAVRLGIASVIEIDIAKNVSIKRYALAQTIAANDFEDSENVYPPEAEVEQVE